MNHHNMLLIVELLTIMVVHFVLGQEWLGFYILAIMFSLFFAGNNPSNSTGIVNVQGVVTYAAKTN